MAGAGIRLFEAGEILTAELVNSYLMDQVVPRFATATTRNSSFGGAGQPTLGAGDEGRLCYLDSTNEIQYWNGSTWVSIGNQAVTGIIAAKGDLVVGTTANTITNLAVGVNGKILTADSSTATGVAWSSPTVDDLAITSAKIANLTIVDGNISTTAAISLSKLATGALPTAITVTSANISDLSIVNADVSASAAIALSKLASGTSGQIVVHSSGGVPTATTVSGDVTIDSTGNVQIAADKIVNADINSSAAIAASKISGTAITAADTGTVTSTMIADGTIVNADINTSAAIALGKLADATIDIKTGNYTLQLTDKNKFIKMNITSTANTVTVPLDSTVPFPEGSQIHIIQYGSGKTEIVGASGAVIIYRTPGSFLRAQYSSATLLKCAAANTWMLMGDLSAS